jgi:hypothetical protein
MAFASIEEEGIAVTKQIMHFAVFKKEWQSQILGFHKI